MPHHDHVPSTPSLPASALVASQPPIHSAASPLVSPLTSTWRRRFWLLCIAFGMFLVASSFASVRGWMIMPLHVHDADASGQIAYVMADGPAMWERLHAAADLYHMHRIETIVLLNEQRTAGYNFVRHRSDTRLQREIDFLEMLGVPANDVLAVDAEEDDWLSSRSEAMAVFEKLPDIRQIVVVTSPPHTRRSRLCFERAFPAATAIQVYSAAKPSESAETHLPIWIEYVKLTVYWLLA